MFGSCKRNCKIVEDGEFCLIGVLVSINHINCCYAALINVVVVVVYVVDAVV